ncbi:hypothetical protein SAMN05421858_4614 [Haladaptatus litoreus]|uniref:Uncharacterized protein n=1 Tax=Haladaptatus litoreus TaxID=553468 RepID=A0A1N7EXZ9_9EURY|nr:hypothetical protein SAMN05421858_4614 [Haladaptatus litoreus]
MSQVYRLMLPAEEINLLYPHLREVDALLEFASLGTPDTPLLPRFWAYGSDREVLADQLITAPALTAISKQAVCPDRVCYRVDWDLSTKEVTNLDRLRTLLRDLGVTVLFGCITPAEWVLVCQFPTQEAVLRCYTDCGYPDCRLAHQTDLDFKEYHPTNG